MKHLLSFFCCIFFTATAFSQFQGLDTLIEYQWVNNAWQPASRSINSYNGSCQVTTFLTQEWLTGSASWRNVSFIKYSYNSNNQISLDTIQSWDTTNNIWVNELR